MCECGCTMNDDKYILPGPGKSMYLITLAGHCENCDVGSSVVIEQIDEDHMLYQDYRRFDFETRPLPLQDWRDSRGVCIATGFRKHEFVGAAARHLIGVSSSMFGEAVPIDSFGAEVIAEEMYDDAQLRPRIV